MSRESIEGAAARLRERLGTRGRLTVLTGAGVSAESGVPTFRGSGGWWRNHSAMDLATPEAFARDPALVHAFYNERRRKLAGVAPNAGHLALARLERALAERFTLITQNVDDLHERAGSVRLIHMHGELTKVRCARCANVRAHYHDLEVTSRCPCGGALRPHIVWFGEVPLHLEDAIPEALEAEVFMSVGTSGVVYPAAGFAHAAHGAGALTVTLNLEPSDNHDAFDVQLLGPAGEVLPRLVEAVIG